MTVASEAPGPSIATSVVAGGALMLYVVQAGRFLTRLEAAHPAPQIHGLLVGVVAVTFVLVAVGVAMAIHMRRDPGALVPLVGAALIGAAVCTIF